MKTDWWQQSQRFCHIFAYSSGIGTAWSDRPETIRPKDACEHFWHVTRLTSWAAVAFSVEKEKVKWAAVTGAVLKININGSVI